MRKIIVLLLIITTGLVSFSEENIIGKWHRNDIDAIAELEINENLEFSISATHNTNSGYIDGKLTKIDDWNYFVYIDDRETSGQSCLIVFTDNKDSMQVTVYGDQFGAGASVYYEGKYENTAISPEEYTAKSLDSIIGDKYDIDAIKTLLGEKDLEYFTICFGITEETNGEDFLIIEGFMPGVAIWQNGIIKIKNEYIYILVTDSREDEFTYKYFTNDTSQKEIPEEFKKWHYFKNEGKVIKEIKGL
jgi:hypothetical protein